MGRIGDLRLDCLGSCITFRAIRSFLRFMVVCGLPTACLGSAYDLLAATPQPSFANDVAPIFQKHCMACHSSSEHRSGLSLDSYESLMQGGKHGRVVVPNDALSSRLIAMLEGKINPQMPAGDEPLADGEIAKIRQWINAGATGPAPNEASTPIPTTPAILPEVSVVSPISSLAVSPDGSLLAVGGYREVCLVNPVSGEVVATLSGHADYVRSIAFSPDEKMLAAAGGAPQGAGEIRIWDLHSHQLLRTLYGHKDSIYSVAWSRDGKLIGSGSYDRMVKLWDASTGKELHNLQDHIDAVFAVAFNPTGTELASASQDRTVKIWDVVTSKRLYTLSDASDGLTSVAFSPAGDRVAAVGYDKTIYVWELGATDGHLSQSLIADQDSVLALVWAPDGKTIVTASSDGSIRFRDAKLELRGVIDRQSDWVDALAMSPDSKWLAAGRYNGTLSIYDATTYKETISLMNVFGVKEPPRGDKIHEASK